MRSIQKLSTATPAAIRHELLDTIEQLLILLRRNAEIVTELHDVFELLESLPLAADVYQIARNRLRNALRYVASQEQGAAGYELQLLAGSLRCRELLANTQHTRLRSQPRF